MKLEAQSPSNAAIEHLFLGEQSENEKLLEDLILKVLRHHAAWRRTLASPSSHSSSINQATANAHESVTKMHVWTDELIKLLEQSVAIHSSRYIAHQVSDPLIAAMVGLFAGMLHNQNNVSAEVSPVTGQLEKQVVNQLAEMLGISTPEMKHPIWGHLTSGGTIANFEALWIARNKAYFPYAVEVFTKNSDFKKGTNFYKTIAKAKQNPRRSTDLYAAMMKFLRGTYEDKTVKEHMKKFREYGIFAEGLWMDLDKEIGIEEREIPKGVIITSEAQHYSIKKAAGALGIGSNQVIKVKLRDNKGMDIDELKAAVAQVERDKKKLIAVVVALGTTATGSLDPLADIIDFRNMLERRNKSFIIHVDAAYGAYAKLVNWAGLRYADKYKSPAAYEREFDNIKNADSVTVDPHKLGYVPYPCGGIIFPNKTDKNYVSEEAPYLFHDNPDSPKSKDMAKEEEAEDKDLGSFTLEGSRPGFAATACWLAHHSTGLTQDGYGKIIGNTIESTRDLANLVDSSRTLEKVHSPDLNLLCITLKGDKNKKSTIEKIGKAIDRIYEELLSNQRQEQYGKFLVSLNHNNLFKTECLRICILDPFMKQETLREFVTTLDNMVPMYYQ